MLQTGKGKSKRRPADPSLPAADQPQSPDAPVGTTAAAGTPPQAREQHIAVIAYYKAEQRGFQGNAQLDDWLAAEREYDGAYLARTSSQQQKES